MHRRPPASRKQGIGLRGPALPVETHAALADVITGVACATANQLRGNKLMEGISRTG